MNFVYEKYLILVLIVILILGFFHLKQERNYFKWIEMYFFKRRSKLQLLSSICFLGCMSLFLLSLLDLRGEEEKVKAEIPDQKTLIIIDSSASMLAEDIRPSRFKKSLMMARHFVKKAVGHQIAVVLFSDTQKRLVPFTDDIDLLDARIAGMESLDLNRGGSNITQAIQESIQYFKIQGGIKDVSGNVLVFTDTEENETGLKLDIPDGVSLAMVGVGTVAGGAIPIRDSRGVFKGYKEFRGEKIISKLNEDFLKKISSLVKNYRYWITLSYNIPTEEILSFFRTIHKEKISKGDRRVRPVKYELLLLPAIAFFIISVVLRHFRTLSALSILMVLANPVFSQDTESLKELPPLSDEVVDIMEKDKKGVLKPSERLNLARSLLVEQRAKESSVIYKEAISKSAETNSHINWGTAHLASGEIPSGISVYLDKLKDKDSMDPQQIETIQKNLLVVLRQEKQKRDQKKNDQKKDQKDDKNQKGDNQNSNDGKSDNNEKKNKNDKQNEKNKKNKQDKKSDKQNKDGKDGDKKKQEPQSLEEKEEQMRLKRKMVKVPALLKQLLNDDRNIQKEYMDTTQDKKPIVGGHKDW